MPEGVAATESRPATGRILIVDDEPAIVDSLRLLLESEGYQVNSAATASECLESITSEPRDLVLLDLMLPDRPGLEVLHDIRKIDHTLPVVMLTAFGSIETAIEATRLGATNFLTKPWNNRQLLLEIQQVLARRRLEAENARLRSQLGSSGSSNRLVRKSRAMEAVFSLIDQVAPTSSTVLISGESGTGKQLVARAIHERSTRGDKPFVTINPETIPVELLESTLFGHVKGSFAGAARDREGCFAIANKGTIFFDEVSALSTETQSKLLRVIEEREFIPVGSIRPIQVDVRIVAATNEDLKAAADEGRFREDLYYRLNVIGIVVPPLRYRIEDIAPLIKELLTHFCRREKNHFLDHQQNSTLRFTPEALRILQAHSWPGNVRELRNAVERAVVLATGEELPPEVLPPSILKGNRQSAHSDPAGFQRVSGASLSEMVEGFERRLLVDVLDKHGFNQTETAKDLQVPLSTLNQKIRRLGIEVKGRRTD